MNGHYKDPEAPVEYVYPDEEDVIESLPGDDELTRPAAITPGSIKRHWLRKPFSNFRP